MKYTEGIKYRLDEDLEVKLDLKGEFFSGFWMELRTNGIILLKRGYVWDGASGIALDSKYTQEASAVHDALYRLIRKGVINKNRRKEIDKEFLRLLLKAIDKMETYTLWDKIKKSALIARSHAWYYAVRIFGRFYV